MRCGAEVWRAQWRRLRSSRTMRAARLAPRLGVPIAVVLTCAMLPTSAMSSRAALMASCQSYVAQGPNGPGRACWTAVRLGALSESRFGAVSGPARAAASPRWRCSAFVSNIFRTGRDVNVWSFQSCSPQPAFTRVRTCIQMKQGFVFQWRKNLRCEERRASGAATGFVELEFATGCRAGTHKYRGQVDGYSYPPAGAGVAGSVRELKTSC